MPLDLLATCNRVTAHTRARTRTRMGTRSVGAANVKNGTTQRSVPQKKKQKAESNVCGKAKSPSNSYAPMLPNAYTPASG